jgi:enoyl reductase-like protein
MLGASTIKNKTMNIDSFLDSVNIYLYTTFIITYLTGFTLLIKSKMDEMKRNRKLFNETVKKGVKEGLINNLSDLRNVHNGIYQREISEKSTIGMSRLLKSIYVENLNDDSSDKKELHLKLSNLINENERISPFSDLPELEKNTLTDISQIAREKSVPYIEDKLKELSKIILSRFQELEQSKRMSKYSLIFGVISTIITIIFGLFSIIV